jgi:hypothetical protein
LGVRPQVLSRRSIALALLPALALESVLAAAEDSLVISDQAIEQLKSMRAEPKFVDSLGIIGAEERAMLEPVIDDLLDRLLSGIRSNPQASWVLDQMDPTVEAFYLEDTELREPCVEYIQRILQILGIQGTNGAFKKYYLDF